MTIHFYRNSYYRLLPPDLAPSFGKTLNLSPTNNDLFSSGVYL
jgi:hypothetical protein